MWFDLTPEAALDSKKLNLYRKLQIILYLSAIFLAFYFAFKILFPSLFFQFNYSNPNANSNTITKPLTENGQTLNHGFLPSDKKAYFYTSLAGNFSQAVITVILDEKSPKAGPATEATARRSYQSFLYPTQEFAEKTETNPGPFRDGSLISYGDSSYVVSNGNIFPIDSPITFISKGYLWEDVIPASGDEVAPYEKGKIFTIANPHPDGTIFKTIETGKYYVIRNKSKIPLTQEEVTALDQSFSPIIASENSLDMKSNCQFKKNIWPLRSYSCEIPIENMQQLIGSDYEFMLSSYQDMQIDKIDIEFKKEISLKNIRLTLGEMFNRIKNNYVQ